MILLQTWQLKQHTFMISQFLWDNSESGIHAGLSGTSASKFLCHEVANQGWDLNHKFDPERTCFQPHSCCWQKLFLEICQIGTSVPPQL